MAEARLREVRRLDCQQFQRSIAEVRTGRLDAARRREFDAHRSACPACDALARRRLRPPRLIAAGFLFAFAMSIATLIYTGLLVRGRDAPPESPVTSRPDTAAPPAAGGDTRRDADAASTANDGEHAADDPPAAESAQ